MVFLACSAAGSSLKSCSVAKPPGDTAVQITHDKYEIMSRQEL